MSLASGPRLDRRGASHFTGAQLELRSGGRFHNRCPLILEAKDYDRWLIPHVKEDPSTVPVELMRTYPAEGRKAWRMNPLKGNGPELLERLKSSKTLP